jgi:hypothetical protein
MQPMQIICRVFSRAMIIAEFGKILAIHLIFYPIKVPGPPYKVEGERAELLSSRNCKSEMD